MMEPHKMSQASVKESVRVNVRAKGMNGTVPGGSGLVVRTVKKVAKPGPSIGPVTLRKEDKPGDEKRITDRAINPARSEPEQIRDDKLRKTPAMWLEPEKLFKGARNVIEWGSPSNPFRTKSGSLRPVSSRVLQVIFSILGAVLLGMAMGFSVLNLFFADDVSTRSQQSIDSHLPQPSNPPENKANEQETPAVTTVEEEWPTLPAVLLQAGNFNDRERARKMVQQLRTKGLAAVMSETAPYRIFLGISPDRDQALKLSSIFQNQQVDVYLKEMELGGKFRTDSETAGKLRAVLERGHGLYTRLGAASVSQIRQDGKAPSPSAFSESWLAEYRTFVTEYQGLAKALPAAAKGPVEEMVRALDQAVQSGDEVRRHPSQALLWQTQEGLVRYVLAYEKLHHALGIR
ncbi:SPOR domain-containing protein [Staphylospora marina]|uniref:SPOR domain-containing protein n=1 Tax=Staphylospora marina TaxID=2490858 RepID=UPI000F5BB18A|nr:SPOR domain-containing protein [Staphylospora marina]